MKERKGKKRHGEENDNDNDIGIEYEVVRVVVAVVWW